MREGSSLTDEISPAHFSLSQNLKIIDLQQPDFLRTLENSVQFGSPVLLQNVQEELDPSLGPILNKSLIKQGGLEVNPMKKLYSQTHPKSQPSAFWFILLTKTLNYSFVLRPFKRTVMCT